MPTLDTMFINISGEEVPYIFIESFKQAHFPKVAYWLVGLNFSLACSKAVPMQSGMRSITEAVKLHDGTPSASLLTAASWWA